MQTKNNSNTTIKIYNQFFVIKLGMFKFKYKLCLQQNKYNKIH